MDTPIASGRHRTGGAEVRYAVRLTRNGPRRQARRVVRRATRRSVSFVVLASMMTAQTTMAGALALWSPWSWLTQAILGVAVGFGCWAVAFLVMEAVAAMRTVKVISDAYPAVREHSGDDAADDGMQLQRDDARWLNDEPDDQRDSGLANLTNGDGAARSGAEP